jgi:uncharacterized membrane protein YfcA
LSILIFTSILLIGSVVAGLVGSLTGLGGGVVLTGAMIGARVLRHADVTVLRTVFVFVIVALAGEMLYSSFTGNLCC